MRRLGFSLTELMFSILILGLGLIAVAGLFPVAGTMQKSTYDDMVALQVAHTAMAAIDSRGFSRVDLNVNPFQTTNPGEVVRFPPQLIEGDLGNILLHRWEEKDRCYPYPVGNPQRLDEGSFCWVPLVKRDPFDFSNPLGIYQFYVFVLKINENYQSPGGSGERYANPKDPPEWPRVIKVDATALPPSTFRVSGAQVIFQTGDQILDNRGAIHTVLLVEGDNIRIVGTVNPDVTALWYGDRGGLSQSPTRRIFTLGDGVAE